MKKIVIESEAMKASLEKRFSIDLFFILRLIAHGERRYSILKKLAKDTTVTKVIDLSKYHEDKRTEKKYM